MEFQLTCKSRWPEELTCKFVELYKGHSCLWNIHSPEYKDKYMKRIALENMSQSIGIQGFGINDVRTKIRNLRGTYQQEIMKIEKSKLRNDNYVYVPNMKWFGTMHELMSSIKNNSSDTNQDKNKVKLEPKSSEEPEDEFEEQFYEYLEDDIHFEEQELSLPNDENSSSSQATVPSSLPLISPSNEVPQKSNNFSFISCGYSNANSRKKRLQENNPDEESPPEKKPDLELWDECSIFGKYIGISLRKLPVEYSIQAQQEIQECLTRYRLLAMKTTNSSTGSGTSKT